MRTNEIPPHITLEHILSRCVECPACGKQTEWRTHTRHRPPTIDVTTEKGKTKWFVRRLVWRLTHPDARMPNGLTSVITSKCPNKLCVDPQQVYATTKSQAYRWHAARGTWSGPKAAAISIRASKARNKLSDEAVLEIITSDTTTAEAAQKWGITTSYVRMLRTGKFRRDITVAANPFSGPAGLLR